jgi:ribosomal protein L37AE/L43A
MKKNAAKQQPANSNLPKCPVCGRKSTVRRLDERMHYCDHCRQAFNP